LYRYFIKRFFDIIFSLVLILFLLPFLIFLYLIIYIISKSNPIFTQERIGLHGTKFKIYKFKSMLEKYDEYNILLPDIERTYFLGNILRKLSIDELPQFFNILSGQMSFIGPRPLLPRYVPLYNTFQNRRHEVKPGITGLAQIKGRNNTSWDTRFNFDIYYVDNLSFKLDLKIFINTISKVLSFSNISPKDKQFMDEFKGNN
jgi:lipopolysaccharide/colanic/teichoic acid biosynthesis glycosyltransferase